jgi:hypothetical protein
MSAVWIDVGLFQIGNTEYGDYLARVDFWASLRDKLSDEQQQELANEIEKIIEIAIQKANQ